jgi:NADH-quinone oxidoreductase subunit N
MLAYSSIAHAGYMALGLIAASDEGRMGVLFYLTCYTIMNLGAFGVVYIIDGRERNAQTLDDYAGLGFKYPVLAFLMSLFLVAMAGLPPTAGFTSKFYVLSAAIKEGYLLLAALGMITSVFALFYYLRVIWYMYFREPERDVTPARVPLATSVALIATALGVLYFGMLPEGLSRMAMAAQQSLVSIF